MEVCISFYYFIFHFSPCFWKWVCLVVCLLMVAPHEFDLINPFIKQLYCIIIIPPPPPPPPQEITVTDYVKPLNILLMRLFCSLWFADHCISTTHKHIKLKGIVHPQMLMWCLSVYPQGIQDVGDIVSSVEHKQRFLTQFVADYQSYNGSQWDSQLWETKKHTQTLRS